MAITTAYEVETIESNPSKNSAVLTFSDKKIVEELLNKETFGVVIRLQSQSGMVTASYTQWWNLLIHS